jgi:hypothetical protein
MRTGVTRRAATVAALAAAGLAVSAAGGGAAAPARVPILGVVPHVGAPQAFGPSRAATPSNLLLNTQPCTTASLCWVMRANTTYAIYWIPSGPTGCNGNPCSVDANYRSTIDRYLADVAAASGRTDNVYSTDTQYYDSTGAIDYRSTFAGSIVDTNPFPVGGCHDGTNTLCLTDQQIEDEIQNVLTANGWHGSTTTLFFLMTPDGVGSCFDGGSTECTSTAKTGYCAYHSGFFDLSGEPVLYANEPYDATISGCFDSSHGQGTPNGGDADATINTISHEQNEAVTDPRGNAWYAPGGDENGDLCAWQFGPSLNGSSGAGAYNQVINGHQYSLQMEWSNDGSACLQHYAAPPANFAAPAVSGSAGEGRILSTTTGLWTNSATAYSYQWQQCASNGTGCVPISGATGATYTLGAADVGHVVRSTVSAGNSVGSGAFAVSAPTAVVVPPPAATSAPGLSGAAAVGKKLSTTTGAWSTAVSSYAYQWLRCTAHTGCSTIGGATSKSYVVKGADAGHRLVVQVSATNAAGTVPTLSRQTAVVVAKPGVRRRPRIAGAVRTGRRVRARTGRWRGSPRKFAYVWLRCSPSGGRCVRIPHATHVRYRVQKSDVGHRLRVRVTARNLAGRKTVTSRATARIRR